MQQCDFIVGEWKYYLIARGEVSKVTSALKLTQRFLETNETQPMAGIIEVSDCTVTIRAVHQSGW